MDKAQRFLAAAQLAFEHGQYESAVSRAYYAAYHMVAWVLLERGNIDRERWDHIQLHKAFVESFCKKGFLFTAADGDLVKELQDERADADYQNVRFNQRRVERLIARTDALCAKIAGATS